MEHAKCEEKYLAYPGSRGVIIGEEGEELAVYHDGNPTFVVYYRSGEGLSENGPSYVVACSEQHVRDYFNHINVLITKIEVIQAEGIAIYPVEGKASNLPQNCSAWPLEDNPVFEEGH